MYQELAVLTLKEDFAIAPLNFFLQYHEWIDADHIVAGYRGFGILYVPFAPIDLKLSLNSRSGTLEVFGIYLPAPKLSRFGQRT